MLDKNFVRKKLLEFLEEDVGHQDITTDNLDTDRYIEAYMIAKEDGILAGIEFAKEVYNLVGGCKLENFVKDGVSIKKGDILAIVYGSGKSILKAERLSLNIVQRLSGIATLTNKYVEKIKDTGVRLLDTRKTTPGFRAFEKYAVKAGGGDNHRFALYDMVMIKDNHIALAGSITEAVNQIKKKVSPMVKIEVEVSSFEQLEEALKNPVDIIMLDNMSAEDVKKAVKLINKSKLIEVSGNITIENIRDYALAGPDFISTGAVIHSAKWLDISLKFK
ncbi:carboxylating nicotinate-nucleotide diphosphorylase [Sulfurihydrogenibium yellowstonense]|jgi:nicotinate-nucleotide pyrophosphorylase [carboxylating] (EC 2.4.2.19)|uniref:Probable nicotinate-nucleotide pyrophosphorylase [carboxylating] n=1 Tax=Sulfurihydrogenibium yellowstonense SS-5 TaxID=432331 RepID=C4FIJ3_9AQUI|nr:carboxylating nicotinate-nucleotide diphosphorylase [Sulfurihydrogenibium yellowstonense]EEP61101.1 nicotinate-nucleotide diphosphorylase (carboxylating) [Sulfurihydrogenibium yellowstonense SS-5]